MPANPVLVSGAGAGMTVMALPQRESPNLGNTYAVLSRCTIDNAMAKKVLVTLYGNDVAPRFDLATEVLIASVADDGTMREEKTMVLPQASAEKLCHMVLTEEVHAVICGGIEQEYYEYLTWKRVNVIDSVVGFYEAVLQKFGRGTLKAGDILFEGTVEEGNGH